jgi:hypothetical protein
LSEKDAVLVIDPFGGPNRIDRVKKITPRQIVLWFSGKYSKKTGLEWGKKEPCCKIVEFNL